MMRTIDDLEEWAASLARSGIAHLAEPLAEFAAAWRADIERLQAENEALRRDAERYATARKMNPQQWKAAWDVNIRLGKPFDQIIDELRPFAPK